MKSTSNSSKEDSKTISPNHFSHSKFGFFKYHLPQIRIAILLFMLSPVKLSIDHSNHQSITVVPSESRCIPIKSNSFRNSFLEYIEFIFQMVDDNSIIFDIFIF